MLNVELFLNVDLFLLLAGLLFGLLLRLFLIKEFTDKPCMLLAFTQLVSSIKHMAIRA